MSCLPREMTPNDGETRFSPPAFLADGETSNVELSESGTHHPCRAPPPNVLMATGRARGATAGQEGG